MLLLKATCKSDDSSSSLLRLGLAEWMTQDMEKTKALLIIFSQLTNYKSNLSSTTVTQIWSINF